MWILLFLLNARGESCGECCGSLVRRDSHYTYTFYQDSGRLAGGAGDYFVNAYGYSGNNTNGIQGRNNPKYECLSNIGPAPATLYQLGQCSNFMHGDVIRPCAFPLIPLNEKEMCGRFGMWIHGCQCCQADNPTCDYSEPPCGTCSEGCIVINIINRVKLRTGDFLRIEHNDPLILSSIS